MKTTRRTFLRQAGIGGLLLSGGNFPLHAAIGDPDITKISIMHTNDVHSRIEPFPQDGSRIAGLGGAARRSALIAKLRSSNPNNLLLDCGDIIQGTPYFNFFGGELEMKIMSEMQYDAGTMGNHDFDGGMDGFDKLLPLANFPFLVANYNFDDTILKGKIQKYKIFKKDGIKIGVFGLGIELNGLVPKGLYLDTQYLDPIKEGNKIAELLKMEMKCDYVICLSHLGYKYDNQNISDIVLAKKSKYIDLILGGHTHTFLKEATLEKNLLGKDVIINQVGYAGILLGHIDLFFERNKKGKCMTCKNLVVK